jgi:hypothetical protein
LTELEAQNLERIKHILDAFGVVSGLECNLQKSNVLMIGDEPVLTDNLRNTGFSFKDRITVLGFSLDNTDEMLTNNTNIILNKVTNQIKLKPSGPRKYL